MVIASAQFDRVGVAFALGVLITEYKKTWEDPPNETGAKCVSAGG